MASQRRTRLSPVVRRDLILDEAAAIVLVRGPSAVSMEELAEAANVSKALVYTYFKNRLEVLGALLVREVKRFQHEGRAAVQKADGFEEMIRVTTGAYLDHVSKRGVLIQRLMNDPQIALSIRELDDRERGITISYLAKEVARRYGIESRRARLVAELLMGVTGRAADMQHRGVAKRRELEELTLSIIFSSLEHIAGQQRGKSAEKPRAGTKTSPRRRGAASSS